MSYALVGVQVKRRTVNIHQSDEQLVTTLTYGDADALSVLWDRHARPAFSLALRILGDVGWAEEVVQDVFYRLWSNPQAYDVTRVDLRRWLLTITHHASVDGLRSKCGTARARNSGPEPLNVLSHAELPDAQHEVVELMYFRGLTQAEIARQTGQPLGTVKTRVRLGARKLRDLLIQSGVTE